MCMCMCVCGHTHARTRRGVQQRTPRTDLTYVHVCTCINPPNQDIENVRMEKIRRGMQGMSDTVLRGRSVMSTKVRVCGV